MLITFLAGQLVIGTLVTIHNPLIKDALLESGATISQSIFNNTHTFGFKHEILITDYKGSLDVRCKICIKGRSENIPSGVKSLIVGFYRKHKSCCE